ncbi:hypothetical protein ACOME3_001555 [Neoechinorhynchus agilis]
MELDGSEPFNDFCTHEFECTIENENILLKIDQFEFELIDKKSLRRTKGSIEVGAYEGGHCDGMYLFCSGEERVLGRPKQLICSSNKLIQSIQLQFSRSFSTNLTFNIYGNSDFVEIIGVLGNMGLNPNISRDAFIRYATDINSGEEF